jgi:hypothetical protein
LKNAADTHYIFKELADLTTYLLQRSKLAPLPQSMEKLLKLV